MLLARKRVPPTSKWFEFIEEGYSAPHTAFYVNMQIYSVNVLLKFNNHFKAL
jgi:hypothetical protein